MSDEFVPCVLRRLPQDKCVDAAKIAMDINPANSPLMDMVAQFAMALMLPDDTDIHPDRIALLASKWWKSGGVCSLRDGHLVDG